METVNKELEELKSKNEELEAELRCLKEKEIEKLFVAFDNALEAADAARKKLLSYLEDNFEFDSFNEASSISDEIKYVFGIDEQYLHMIIKERDMMFWS